MNPWLLLLTGWAAMALVMAAIWAIQYRRGYAGIVDAAWALGIGALSIFFCAAAEGYEPRQVLIAAIAGFWALRLGVHLLRRVLGGPEDGRYQAMRRRWGPKTQPYLFIFFQIQAIWSVLFAAPMLIAARNGEQPLGLLDAAAVLVWALSILGESVADRQLARFRANRSNRGQVCRSGLWRYSRHPNYFFEWFHWWAYVLLGWQAPWGALTLMGPALMLVFLLKITGVPPTEAQALASRGDAYREYQRTTSVFFPWPPKQQETRS